MQPDKEASYLCNFNILLLLLVIDWCTSTSRPALHIAYPLVFSTDGLMKA